MLYQKFVECFVLTNQVILPYRKQPKIMSQMNNWQRISVSLAHGNELAVAAIQQFWLFFSVVLVFKINLISWLSVEYCNNSAVNTIKITIC